MPKTESAEYKFTVKEGAPSETSGDAPVFLMCEPEKTELSFLGQSGFLSINLKDGTSISEAQEIANHLQKYITSISATTF